MKIVNEAGLPFKVIGEVIDQIIETNYGDTIYYGKVEVSYFEYKKQKYKLQIRYMKRFIEWWFSDCEE